MLIDTTLREGAQLFGAYFSMEARKRIVTGLLELKVDELELGWVGQEGTQGTHRLGAPPQPGRLAFPFGAHAATKTYVGRQSSVPTA